MMRVLIATVVAGVILFVWGFLAWGVTGMHETTGGKASDEVALAAALKAHLPVSGAYALPYPPDDKEAWPEYEERHQAGPIAFISIRREGGPVMQPMMFVNGFAVYLANGLVMSLLLFMVRGSLTSYVARVVFVTALGLVTGLKSDLVMWNWFYFPIDWTMMNVLDHVIGYGACGVAIGAIIKKRPEGSV